MHTPSFNDFSNPNILANRHRAFRLKTEYEEQELNSNFFFFFQLPNYHLSTYQFGRNYRHYLVIFNRQFHHESDVIDPYIRQFFGNRTVIIVASLEPEAKQNVQKKTEPLFFGIGFQFWFRGALITFYWIRGKTIFSHQRFEHFNFGNIVVENEKTIRPIYFVYQGKHQQNRTKTS